MRLSQQAGDMVLFCTISLLQLVGLFVFGDFESLLTLKGLLAAATLWALSLGMAWILFMALFSDAVLVEDAAARLFTTIGRAVKFPLTLPLRLFRWLGRRKRRSGTTISPPPPITISIPQPSRPFTPGSPAKPVIVPTPPAPVPVREGKIKAVPVVLNNLKTLPVSESSLTGLDELGSGGEARVYRADSTSAWKIFREPSDPFYEGDDEEQRRYREGAQKRAFP